MMDMWVDPKLRSAAKAHPHEVLEVVVVLDKPQVSLRPGASRKEIVDARRAAFDLTSKSVKKAISDAGGKVVDETWLSSSLKVMLPAEAIEILGGAAGVQALDVPGPLIREA